MVCHAFVLESMLWSTKAWHTNTTITPRRLWKRTSRVPCFRTRKHALEYQSMAHRPSPPSGFQVSQGSAHHRHGVLAALEERRPVALLLLAVLLDDAVPELV